MLLLWWLLPLLCVYVVDPHSNQRGRGTLNVRRIQRRVLEHVFEHTLVSSQADAVRSEIDEYKVPWSTVYSWLSHWRKHDELKCDTIAFYRQLRKKSKYSPLHGNAAFDREKEEILQKIV